MGRAKYHIRIEAQRLGQDSYVTYFLCDVHTMPDGEEIVLNTWKDTNIAKIRSLAQLQADSYGCRVVEESL